jgi:hypothetical protein
MKEFTNDDADWAKQTVACRQIVKTINEFGVSDFQRLKIIELLSLELEKRDESLVITETVKKIFETRELANEPKRRILL